MSLFDNVELIEEDILGKILKSYNGIESIENLEEDSNIRADRLLWVIEKINAEIKELELEKQKSLEFYDHAIKKKRVHTNHLEECLKGFIKIKDKKTIKLPNGTLRLRTSKKFIFPENKERLIEFCNTRNINTIQTTKPDLVQLKKYITKTGDMPEGLEIEDTDSFSYQNTGGE